MGRVIKVVKENKLYVFILAVVTCIAFQVRLDEGVLSGNVYYDTISNLSQSFNSFSMSNIVILPLLYFFYRFAIQNVLNMDKKWTIILPAVLFAIFMVLGYSFEQINGWYLVKDIRNGQLIKTLFCLTGYFIFFFLAIACVYNYLDNLVSVWRDSGIKKVSNGLLYWYMDSLSKHPFVLSFVTMFIAYIPYVVISYPAIFQGDTYSQIVQAYKELETSGIYYMSNDQLLSSSVFINQHHPVIHTLLIHMFLVIGTYMFHSLNVGIFLYSLFQWLICLLTVSYGIKVLIKEAKVSSQYAILVVLYFIISPRIQNYMFLVTKDVLYGMCVLLEIIAIFQICCHEERNNRDYMLLFFVAIGMILFRNEAVYILVISFVAIACIYKRIRRKMLYCAGGILLFFILVFKVLFPALCFTPGSIREVLAVPFQQTARYVRDFGDEVTLEEKEAISAILNYSKLTEKYDPNNVDNVKATYNEYASEEELTNYFKVWFKMGLKHPGVYIQATMNNYYRYFYPGPTVLSSNSYSWSEECMNLTNETIAPLGMEFSYPDQLSKFRNAYEFFRGNLDQVPIFNILVNPALYVWMIMLSLFYGIRRNNPRMKCLIIMPCFMILIRLLGPCNGQYCRYLYPIMIIIPFIVPLMLYLSINSGYDFIGTKDSK